jgi:hypothetical protein
LNGMFDLNMVWVEVECPNCGYSVDVQLVDAKSERTIYCHNCKINLELKDSEASVHSGLDSIDQALKDLERTLKNFGK